MLFLETSCYLEREKQLLLRVVHHHLLLRKGDGLEQHCLPALASLSTSLLLLPIRKVGIILLISPCFKKALFT